MIRALLVDDEGPARDRLRALLAAHEDVEIVGEAGDGAQALAVVPSADPDVVFLDVAMPERDGFEVAQALPAGPHIVFCTAYERHAVDAFDLNAQGYLLKPVSSAALARTLERLRRRVRADRRVRAAASAQRALLRGGDVVLPALEIAAGCRQVLGVGGDWYDVVQLPKGAVALVVGDVSGKGLDAGIFMASLQAHLEHVLAAHDPSLPAAIEDLHVRALAAGGGCRYATLACVRFDAARRRLDWVVAGHPPPLLVRPGEEHVRSLPAGGPPVGLLERSSWQAGTSPLLPGDCVVLYTDGVAEGMAEEELSRIVRTAAAEGSAAVREALLAHSCSSGIEDDRTVLVARVEVS
jgi:serine phosphatase RsbU (regulator of sigma subunit)